MGMFDIFEVSGSGVAVHRQWMDAISDNISNINTVRRTSEAAFQARYIEAVPTAATPGNPGGVAVAGVRLGSAEGIEVSDPDNPLADAQGMVRRPAIDLGEQMTDLLMAQRGYQANLAVVQRATEAYQAALQLGRSS
ncbi:MAG: flagellar basal body rod C-terminal domain-containing protein [Candidatus Nanopelagicales bacterium]